jgi:hypothetical protein
MNQQKPTNEEIIDANIVWKRWMYTLTEIERLEVMKRQINQSFQIIEQIITNKIKGKKNENTFNKRQKNRI